MGLYQNIYSSVRTDDGY